ncbi:MAG TPA: hypothetical protein VFA95_15585 [Gammaproteobacteria bacterium]|nr:hypothetical protein [Gammaproteobacteria bacterium]
MRKPRATASDKRPVVYLEGLNPGGHAVSRQIDAASEKLEDDRIQEAADRIDAVLAEYPDHVDALHLQALVARRQGRPADALERMRCAVAAGASRIPEQLPLARCLMPGDHAGNLPFLRAYCGLGLELMEHGRVEEAFRVFATSLDLCFLDPFEVRRFIPLPAFLLGRNRTVLEVCRRYVTDASAPLRYGRPLAMLRLHRSRPTTRAVLARAVEGNPLVARVLLLDRKPDIQPPAGIRDEAGLGEAMDYLRMYGRLWRETPGALDMLRRLSPRGAGGPASGGA